MDILIKLYSLLSSLVGAAITHLRAFFFMFGSSNIAARRTSCTVRLQKGGTYSSRSSLSGKICSAAPCSGAYSRQQLTPNCVTKRGGGRQTDNGVHLILMCLWAVCRLKHWDTLTACEYGAGCQWLCLTKVQPYSNKLTQNRVPKTSFLDKNNNFLP